MPELLWSGQGLNPHSTNHYIMAYMYPTMQKKAKEGQPALADSGGWWRKKIGHMKTPGAAIES